MTQLEARIFQYVIDQVATRSQIQHSKDKKIYEKTFDDSDTIKTAIIALEDDDKWKVRVVTNIAPAKLNKEVGDQLINRLMDIVKSTGKRPKHPITMINKIMKTSIDIGSGSPVPKDFPKYYRSESMIIEQLYVNHDNTDLTLFTKDISYHFVKKNGYITMNTSAIITVDPNNATKVLIKEVNKWKSFHSSFKIPKLPTALSQSPSKLFKILSNTISSTTDTDNVIDIILSYIMHPHTTYDY